MKYLIITFLLVLQIQASNKEFTVLLSCDNINTYIATCAGGSTPSEEVVEAPIYTLTQPITWGYGEIKGTEFVGQVEVRYLDATVPTFKTLSSDGLFSVDVLPNKAFYIYAYNYDLKKWASHGVKFILRISKSGKELWRMWKPSTKRWIKLDTQDNTKKIQLDPEGGM